MSDNTEKLYKPDEEEIQDAVVFMNACSENDLIEGWNRISSEWDLESVVTIHRFLCGSGRINELIDGFRKNF